MWLGSALILTACSPDTGSLTSPDGGGTAEVAAPGGPQASGASVDHEMTLDEAFELPVFIPCANGGLGEEVLFVGTSRVIDHAVITGTRVTVFQVVEQHQTGTGPITGDRYELAFAYHFKPVSASLVNGQSTMSFTAHLAITAPGSGNNMYLPLTIHVTVNAAGDITADVERFPVICK
jgi:hypothetical protein